MLGLVHTLLLWSDHARHSGNKPNTRSLSVLILSVGAWLFIYQTEEIVALQCFCALLALSYGYHQRSFWPLTLIPITSSMSAGTHTMVDGLLQSLHAASLGTLLQAQVLDTTVIWQGVSVHVGPSCVNLLMFQGAAAIGWLATQTRKLQALLRTLIVLIGFAAALNFIRILCLTLLAPLAPNEATWFLIHDGVSLAASIVLVIYIWRRLKRQSKPSASKIPLQAKNQ